MAMTYGVTDAISINDNNAQDYLFVTGTNGTVVKHFKKFRRIEKVTETLPASFEIPTMTPPSAGGFRKELRLSPTDFARLTTTAVTFGQIS